MTEWSWSWDDIDIERCWDEIWDLWRLEGFRDKLSSHTIPEGVHGIEAGEEVEDAQMSWHSLNPRWMELSQWANQPTPVESTKTVTVQLKPVDR